MTEDQMVTARNFAIAFYRILQSHCDDRLITAIISDLGQVNGDRPFRNLVKSLMEIHVRRD